MFESIVSGREGRLKWLNMDYSIVRKNQSLPLSQWTGQDQILMKVGMTRKATVLARLLEWENSCKHPITGLDLSKVEQLHRLSVRNQSRPKHSSSLVRLFRKLSISKTQKAQKAQKNAPNLDKIPSFRDGGFYVTEGRSLELIETKIHQLLWKKYGQGLIYCYGCKNEQGQPKRHREWFMVPLDQVKDIFWAISAICSES
ncbi:LAME_0A01024g1_1 [Lachancea meyersii CBS 8951]|uniref:LAME_0A01024g1_1 n=1 Tax=Lachancea meyersii CBS 8951 TaxID=1266667 RepID=A0A1G4ILG0_9SACH|nr:LAME_0A01024g1_1 [Lachancea meyersii CBS 8951]